MSNNFDEVVNRRNTNSYKWDVEDNELPMWVADMDFKTAPEVIDAIRERVEHGIFGYNAIPTEWNKAIVGWWERRHNFKMNEDWLLFCTGVIPAISSVVRKVTTIGENVVVMSPVYNIFFNSIVNNGRNPLENKLEYIDHEYYINFDRLEEDLKNPQTSLLILCNPHNPIGKIWDKDTLSKIGDLCYKYDVIVLSDEIHCDLTTPGINYVPFASVSDICRDNSITCMAPSKAFNLAGLKSAIISVPNDNLRHKVWRAINTDEVAEPNAFAIPATIAAFEKGEKWLDNLRDYIAENRKIVSDFLTKEIKEIKLVSGDATYLLWIDCSSITEDTDLLYEYLRSEVGLYLSKGSQYKGDGNKFLRVNIACTKSNLKEGLYRLQRGVESFKCKDK